MLRTHSEMASLSQSAMIGDDNLQSWQIIGGGRFGVIHKAKHVEWGMDVAIKLLQHDDSQSLLREANLMRQGGSPFVLRVLGVYQGCPLRSCNTQLGLVMQFMERGSLASFHEDLRGPSPCPLAVRLAHQIALGMNFLHCLRPPLLHLDLKPSNVLLDDSLTAQLTDFGLARLVKSHSSLSESEEGGTISYMPPEAFSLEYKPTPASDVYSYGILLWSILTGQQPYQHAFSSIVRFRIPEGDRPNLEEIQAEQAESLGQLIDLMEICWDGDSLKRPSFHDCLRVTEKVFEVHKDKVHDAVHQVLKQLDLGKCLENVNNCSAASLTAGSLPVGQTDNVNSFNHVKTGSFPVQETAGKSAVKDNVGKSSQPIGIHHDPFLSAANREQKGTSPFPKEQSVGYQRQLSSPGILPDYKQGAISIHLSHATGVQIGNNNKMSINTNSRKSRRRNPTAPP